ncbi:MAG: hypothetical protein AAFV88_05280 [Planctomycetota bacterium]
MAKKKSSDGVSKSQAIRDYMKANPKAKPKDVAEALTAKGYDVKPNYVSMIKFQSKKKPAGGTKRRGRPAGSTTTRKPAAAKKTAASSDTVSVDSLVKAKELIEAVGIDEARAALAALERLAK